MVRLTSAEKEMNIVRSKLLSIVQSDDSINIQKEPLDRLLISNDHQFESVEMEFYEKNISLKQAENHFQKQKLFPDLSLNYFQGTNSKLNGNLIGYQLGIKIPVLFGSQLKQIKASKFSEDIAKANYENFKYEIQNKYQELLVRLKQHQQALDYYEEEGTRLSQAIIKTADLSFKNGEIDFFQYILSMEHAFDIRLSYLESLNNYNQTVIELRFLTL